MTEGTVGTGNAYCDRLQTLRVPRVEEFVGRRILLGTATLFDLMIVALLENGGPMSLEAVAKRLEKAGARSGVGDMLLSLKKSWRRREPIYEDEAGLLALNVTYPELDLRLFTLGLRPPYADPIPEPPPIEIPGEPGEEVPLSLEEVDAAFRGRRLVMPVGDANRGRRTGCSRKADGAGGNRPVPRLHRRRDLFPHPEPLG